MQRIILDKAEFQRLWKYCLENSAPSASRFGTPKKLPLIVSDEGKMGTGEDTIDGRSIATFHPDSFTQWEDKYEMAQEWLDKANGTLILAYIEKYKQMVADLAELPPTKPEPVLPTDKEISVEVLFQWQEDWDNWRRETDEREQALFAPLRFANSNILNGLGNAPEGTHVVYNGIHLIVENEKWWIFTDAEWQAHLANKERERVEEELKNRVPEIPF